MNIGTKQAEITFPCDIGLKVVAESMPGIEAEILAIINANNIAVDKNNLRHNPSRKANYISISILLLQVPSQQAYADVCTALRAHKHIKILL